MVYSAFRQTGYETVHANSMKLTNISAKIFSSDPGEPRRFALDAQSTLFSVRSRDNCRYAKKTLVFLLVRTVCAAKYSTKIHHIAKNSRINSV